jgi:hypothetical protein
MSKVNAKVCTVIDATTYLRQNYGRVVRSDKIARYMQDYAIYTLQQTRKNHTAALQTQIQDLTIALQQAMLSIRQGTSVTEDSMLWQYWLKLVGDPTKVDNRKLTG